MSVILNAGSGGGGPTPAPSNLTFYVATTGNDSNSGLSPATPVATLQRAITLAASYDYLFLYTWTINIADGTYTTTGDAVIVPGFVHLPPSSTQNIVGNSGSPGNVVLKCANGYVQTADAVNNQVFLDGFTVHLTATSSTYFGIFGGKILYNNLNIDADAALTATAVFEVGNSDLGGTNALIDTNGSNTFTVNSGVAFRFFVLANPSSQSNFNFTQFTFPASITMTAWVNATEAQINWSFNTYTNFAGVAGKQCQASVFCLLITDHGLLSDFPGNTAGTVDNTVVIRDVATGVRALGSIQYAGVPAASTFPNQTWQVFKDTVGGVVYLGYNDNGTMILISAGGGGTPGGVSGDIQYNNSGAFGGAANFTINGSGNPDVASTHHYDYNGALLLATDANENIFVGFGSHFGSISGTQNTLIGNFAGNALTTGASNTVVGRSAFQSATSASSNVAIGNNALNALQTGSGNFGLGFDALNSGTSMNSNVAIGTNALKNVTDDGSVAVGGSALQTVTTGSKSIAIGFAAALVVATDSNSIYIGSEAGINITSGSNNTLVGAWGGPSGSLSGVIALSDGSGTVQTDYNNTNSGAWTFAQNVFLPAGKKVVTPTVQHLGVIIANLPSPVAGMVAYVTDGDSGLAWGATAVNSGSGATKYLVWYNGTNWTVAGK